MSAITTLPAGNPVSPGPVPGPPLPDGQTIEQVDGMFVITRPVHEGSRISCLDELVNDGSFIAYSREGDRLVVYADSADAALKVKMLKIENASIGEAGVVQKLKEVFLPYQMDKNCVEEYVPYRLCSLASSVCSGALSFVTNVLKEKAKGMILDKERIVSNDEIGGYLWKGTSFASSFLAKYGDIDPKRLSTICDLVGTATTIGASVATGIAPGSFLGVALVSMVIFALTSTVGGAAEANISQHMADGPNRGEITSKNRNQNIVAGCLGVPLAMGLKSLAGSMGINPVAFVTTTMGSALLMLNVASNAVIRMEPMTRGGVEKIVDAWISTGRVPEAEQKSWLGNLKSIFRTPSEEVSKRMHFASSREELAGKDADAAGFGRLLELFGDERYMLSYHGSDDTIQIAIKEKGSEFGDVMKAVAHARLVEKALDGGMLPVLQGLCGARAAAALIDLAHRALPEQVDIRERLKEQGWHPSTGALEFKKLDISVGPGMEKGIPVPMEKFLKLAAAPAPEELRKLLRPEDLAGASELPRAA